VGKDPALRQHMAAAIMSTNTLWNAKHFTREMEKAYEEMGKGMLKPVTLPRLATVEFME